MKELSLIILAFNDNESLKTLIPLAAKTLKSRFDKYEIIVVDDCSTDDTNNLIFELQKDFKSIIYHRNSVNKGVGYTFQKGVALASYSAVAYTDGDGQYDLNDLFPMYSWLNSYDIITGHRNSRAEGLYRWAISKTFNTMLALLFNLKLKDTNSALKLYRTEALKTTLPLRHTNGFYDAEILIKATRAGYRIKETHINHYARRFGSSNGAKLKSILNIFTSMISFWYDTRS